MLDIKCSLSQNDDMTFLENAGATKFFAEEKFVVGTRQSSQKV